MIIIPSSEVIFRDTHICFPKISVPGECQLPLDQRTDNDIRIDFDGSRCLDFSFSYLHNMIRSIGDQSIPYYAIENDDVFSRFVGPGLDVEELAKFGDYGEDGWYIEVGFPNGGPGYSGYRRLNKPYRALFTPNGMRVAVCANGHSLALLYSQMSAIASLGSSDLPLIGETTFGWQDHEYHDFLVRS